MKVTEVTTPVSWPCSTRDDVHVLRPDHHVHRDVFAEILVQAGEGLAGEGHLVVLQHDAVQDVTLPDEVGHKGVLGFG